MVSHNKRWAYVFHIDNTGDSIIPRFRIAADKRRYNVLSICPVAHPFTLAGFGMFDGAKLQLFPDIERKKKSSPVQPSKDYYREI